MKPQPPSKTRIGENRTATPRCALPGRVARSAANTACWWALGWVLWLVAVEPLAAQTRDAGQITSTNGIVEVSRAGSQGRWDPASTNAPYSALKAGDNLRTKARSKAT